MSQERVLRFLENNKDTWFNVYLIVAGIIYEDKKLTTDFESIEIQVRRAIVKLNWGNQINSKILRSRTYYKYNERNNLNI